MTADYANNTLLEPSNWDLKLIFGEYSERAKAVEFHTSITVPWAHAKLLLYYLQANVAAHEVINGQIKIPMGAMPPEWPTPKDSNGQRIFEAINPLRQQFLASLGA